MKSKEKAFEILSRWEKSIQNYEEILSDVCDLFGSTAFESKFGDKLHDTMNNYTLDIQDSLGIPSEWLEWYQYENRLGESELEAYTPVYEEGKKVKNIQDLCDIIYDEEVDE